MHGHCDAMPFVTHPAVAHCPLRQRHVCEEPAQSCYLNADWPGVEPVTFVMNLVLSNHYTIITISHLNSYCES